MSSIEVSFLVQQKGLQAITRYHQAMFPTLSFCPKGVNGRQMIQPLATCYTGNQEPLQQIFWISCGFEACANAPIYIGVRTQELRNLQPHCTIDS